MLQVTLWSAHGSALGCPLVLLWFPSWAQTENGEENSGIISSQLRELTEIPTLTKTSVLQKCCWEPYIPLIIEKDALYTGLTHYRHRSHIHCHKWSCLSRRLVSASLGMLSWFDHLLQFFCTHCNQPVITAGIEGKNQQQYFWCKDITLLQSLLTLAQPLGTNPASN